MEQKDRLHPLIALRNFFFIQIDSSDFLLQLLIISQKVCSASFSESVVITFVLQNGLSQQD